MKVFQIVNDICYYDATRKFANVDLTKGKFTPDTLFVEAPDFVFAGWGYDTTQEGDERFIKPTPPEGWLYDDATGTFYEEGTNAPSELPKIEPDVYDELAAAYTEGVNSI